MQPPPERAGSYHAVDAAQPSCPIGNSFLPGTAVAMADGTHLPIEEIQVGDQVLATDPETGQQGARTVTATIIGDGIKQLVDITVEVDQPEDTTTALVTATDGHPFWVTNNDGAGGGVWVDAIQLQPGGQLLASDGELVTITETVAYTTTATVHNLTVEELHTYYITLADTDALVHNTRCTSLPSTHADEFIVLGRREDINVARSWPNHEVLSLPTGTWTIEQNDARIAGAITKRQKVYPSSPLTNENLYNKGPYNWGTTVYAREVGQFIDAGYRLVGDYMLPV